MYHIYVYIYCLRALSRLWLKYTAAVVMASRFLSLQCLASGLEDSREEPTPYMREEPSPFPREEPTPYTREESTPITRETPTATIPRASSPYSSLAPHCPPRPPPARQSRNRYQHTHNNRSVDTGKKLSKLFNVAFNLTSFHTSLPILLHIASLIVFLL